VARSQRVLRKDNPARPLFVVDESVSSAQDNIYQDGAALRRRTKSCGESGAGLTATGEYIQAHQAGRRAMDITMPQMEGTKRSNWHRSPTSEPGCDGYSVGYQRKYSCRLCQRAPNTCPKPVKPEVLYEILVSLERTIPRFPGLPLALPGTPFMRMDLNQRSSTRRAVFAEREERTHQK